MDYKVRCMHVSEDERHHESNESDEWKKERTRELKISRLQSFLRIRGAFILSIVKNGHNRPVITSLSQNI